LGALRRSACDMRLFASAASFSIRGIGEGAPDAVAFISMNLTPTSAFRAMNPARKVELHGATWEYQVTGRGSSGLLLLGGELMFGDNHHRLMGQLDGFRVIAPSWPEVGTVDAVLEGLLALLDHEGLPHVSVFGHAFGAGVAHALMRRAPYRFDTLALSGFGLCSSVHALELRAEAGVYKMFPFTSLKQHYERIFDRLAIDAGARGDELREVSKRLLARHSDESLRRRYLWMAELFAHPERYQLHQRLEDPIQVLLLFANDDHVFSREEQNALARTYASATVTRYLNGGHWVGLLAAQEFERKLKLHFQRYGMAMPISRTRRPSWPGAAASARQPDAETLEWRQDRRLG
jgi:pimeloyl-ACP methyl ester carboxylesterase